MRRKLLAAALAAATCTAHAGDWTGAGELGLAYSRGNANSDSFNAKGAVKKEDGAWLFEVGADALRAKGETVVVAADGSTTRSDRTTANRYGMGGKVGYKFSPHNYVFGTARYDNDDFAPYEWQFVASLGYGHQFIKDETTELSMEAGPGFRRLQPIAVVAANPAPPPVLIRIEPDAETDAVARGAMNYKHKLTQTMELADVLLIESGGGRTFVQNDLGAAVKINAHFSLKAGFQVRYNSNTPAGVENTDRLFTTNVVYGF